MIFFSQLKRKIQAVVDEIVPQLCEKAVDNFVRRTGMCQMNRGGYLPDLTTMFTTMFTLVVVICTFLILVCVGALLI